jgi:(heptosyl)LPS beta-1,4-glucosyltransferase
VRPRLSVAIITKNESRRIRRCLDSIRWADEVVIVDAESTDDTVTICKGWGARIEVRPFENFAKAKNTALALCTGDWILSLDADEVVSSELAHEIRRCLDDSAAPYDIYSVVRENYICGRRVRYVLQNDIQLKLVRREAARFVRGVHEYLDGKGLVGALSKPLHHYNSATFMEFVRKNQLYARLEAQERLRRQEPFSLLKCLFSPVRTVWFRYFTIGGYKDGFIGLLVSLVLGYAMLCLHLTHRRLLLQAQGLANERAS